MKTKLTLLLVFLILPTVPFNSAVISTDDNHELPPAPEFQSLNNTGTPLGSYILSNNTFINIRYKADRFDVQGLILMGAGSNLTTSLENSEYLRNFTKYRSFRGDSFYEVDLNITGYTYFYAYAWYNTISNGTIEELDLLGNAPGHELWIEEGRRYPTFDTADNTRQRDDGLYLQINRNTTIRYQAKNPENNTNEVMTLVMAENETALFNGSTSTHITVERINFTTIDDDTYSIFEFEYNLTSPIVYFTAYNEVGWERSDATTAVVHRLYGGFSFNYTFSENTNLYTNLDSISFNITTYNQTDNMSVGYQYRYFENETSQAAILNWTTIDNLDNSTNEVYLNSTADGDLRINSTRKATYNVTLLESFNVSNYIEIKSFVRYGLASNITSSLTKITIIDSSPIIRLLSRNETLTNKVNATIRFTITTPKGEISSVILKHILPNNVSKTSIDIKDKVNQSILFATSDTNSSIIDGNHTLVINATNSLGVTSLVSIIYTVDRTNPNGTLTRLLPTTATSNTGRVKYAFTYSDIGPVATGVKYVTLNWGNNITINVTSLSEASHTYRRSGTYTVTLTIYDKVGNQASAISQITINIERVIETDTGSNPAPIIPAVIVLLSMVTVYRVRLKKKILY